MIEKNVIHRYLDDICKELNIKYKYLSKDWIIKLEKNNKIRFITGYKFDLNNYAIGHIFDDKYGLYEILKDENIPVIEHNIFYSETNEAEYAKDCKDINIIEDYFKKHNNKVVIKSNTGNSGKEVYLIEKIEDIEPIVKDLFIKNYSISYCPYYDALREYRIIVLKNNIKLIYQKIKPIVKGNGTSTIKELLLEFNPYYFNDIELDDSFNRVLKLNEEYQYDWKFNLSKGAIAKVVDNQDTINDLTKIVNSITNKFDIGFCSIDIIEMPNKEYYVMEINSGVTMKKVINTIGEDIVKDIYKEAINQLFIDC